MDRRILITNDDGIQSPALDALEHALRALGPTTVVAPDRERSAGSHSITVNRPLRHLEIGPNRYAVDGTPADCVIVACMRILRERPALVVSGINRGRNIGDDTCYSGTLAAAYEAALQGIPGLASSREYSDSMDFHEAAGFTALVAGKVLEAGLPRGVVLNLNFPAQWNGELRLTRQAHAADSDLLVENPDAKGELDRWLRSGRPAGNVDSDLPTDWEVMKAGYASLTPLQVDRTAYRYAALFSGWPQAFADLRARNG